MNPLVGEERGRKQPAAGEPLFASLVAAGDAYVATTRQADYLLTLEGRGAIQLAPAAKPSPTGVEV
jgi:hypothetical protein